jgi:hypothetical protein
MSSAVAQCLAGALAALVVVLGVEATPRALRLEANRVLEGSVHQLDPEDSEAVVEASSRAALVDAVVVAEALEETEALAAAEEADSAVVVEEALAVGEVESVTSLTATAVLQTAHPPAPEVHEREVSAAVAEVGVVTVEIEAQAVDTVTTDEAAAVGMIAAPAAQTTNPSATESAPHGTAVETVGMAATTARESAGMKATATTTPDNEGGIERACARVCHKRLPPFLSPLGSESTRVRRAISKLLTFRGQIPSDQRVSTAHRHHHCSSIIRLLLVGSKVQGTPHIIRHISREFYLDTNICG